MDHKSFQYQYLSVDRGQKHLTPTERLDSARVVLACLNSAANRDESLRQACLLGGLDHLFDSYKKLFTQDVDNGGAGYMTEAISELCEKLEITEQKSDDADASNIQSAQINDDDASIQAFLDEHVGVMVRAAMEETPRTTNSVQTSTEERDYLWLENLQGACHEEYRRRASAHADADDRVAADPKEKVKSRSRRKTNSSYDDEAASELELKEVSEACGKKRSRAAPSADADEDQQIRWLQRQIKNRGAGETAHLSDKGRSSAVSSFKTGLEEHDNQLRLRDGGTDGSTSKSNNNGTSAAGHRYKRPWGNAAGGCGDTAQMDDKTCEVMRRVPGLLPAAAGDRASAAAASSSSSNNLPEELRNIDPKLIEVIEGEILDRGRNVTWSDIAGLSDVKRTLKEIIVLPMLRPDLYRGLREPARGLLLFGPPGTGKTMIGKCIASQCRATFFCITASTLTSKWVGEGEKLVRALFAVANYRQPSVVFIDEVDSILSARSDSEHEASRRMKNEFLAQIDGANSTQEGKVLIIGATNLPQSIDSAARRRFVKRMYIPLPDSGARAALIRSLLSKERHSLNDADIAAIAGVTDKYSGADVAQVCREAAMACMRSIPLTELESIEMDEVRPIGMADFRIALLHVKPSVSDTDLSAFEEFNKKFGISSTS